MTFFSKSKATQALDWNRFLDLAENEAKTIPGKTLIVQLKDFNSWASDIQTAQDLQQEVYEILSLLTETPLWEALTDLPDPTELIDRLSRGATLELNELHKLRLWLQTIHIWIQFPYEKIKGEKFKKSLSELFDPQPILKILNTVLDPDGQISENASHHYRFLHSEVRSLKKEIHQTLENLLKHFLKKGIAQENFTDFRDGRYVLPIKVSLQNEIHGIVHEISASRQTAFIEPKEITSLNHQLRQTQSNLLQEIHRILKTTSDQLIPFIQQIQQSIQSVSYWDSIQAKAKLGQLYEGQFIQITEKRYFSLKETFHPLLRWSLPLDSIIRNTITFGEPSQCLLLTGPNTGGKTVLLKTLGLAGICARTGFLFPASESPIIPYCDPFFADLGDSQSLEHQVSSFSGHLIQFKEILENLTDQSLILLDEFNSATDPEEGSAFGRAILETLLSKKSIIITTTHDPHLKALPLSDSRILNASMAFDESSQTPTYHLALGIPGRSRALETAERLGIPQEVISRARSFLSTEHQEWEKILLKLETDLQETSHAKEKAIQALKEAEQLKAEWMMRTTTTTQKIADQVQKKLNHLLDQAQEEIRTSLRKLDPDKNSKEHPNKQKALSRQLQNFFTQTSIQMKSILQREAPELDHTLNLSFKNKNQSLENFKVGNLVKIPKWKSMGKIVELRNDQIQVLMGNVKMTLSIYDVEILNDETSKTKNSIHKKIKPPKP